ncbi:MAG: hypothetical protein ACLFT4_08450 [Bacteroidales bacterium]
MIKDYEIKLGQGFDKIKLGMTKQEVNQILGDPDEIEEFDYADGDHSISYFYNDIGCEITFESEHDYLLSYLAVHSKKFHIKNKIRIGMSVKETLNAADSLNLSKAVKQDLSEEDLPEQELYSFDAENINLWFVDNILDEIEIGPYWKDDDTPIWP